MLLLAAHLTSNLNLALACGCQGVRNSPNTSHECCHLPADLTPFLRQAFKNYDEAGSLRRIQCLKYLVLATMLMESDVDPFDAQEAKPYRQDPDVLAMTNLVDAYQRNNIAEFEKTLKNNRRVAPREDLHHARAETCSCGGLQLSLDVCMGRLLCRRTIMDDPFISNYIEDLLKNIRTQVSIGSSAFLPYHAALTGLLWSASDHT